ncbi:DEAD/DEAH box helicase [Benzoatithermus flavus]|uniref:Helicase-related protein n=1 Tax=Benzoatithermus flavus TaxID=3108223 RepID=A0ABU8XUI3_9PROT
MRTDVLLPTLGCWVHDDQGRVGMALEVRAEGERSLVHFRYGARDLVWIEAKALRSAFAPGMQVEHVPSSPVARSLGLGEVRATRVLAGCEQVLVQFLEQGTCRWLPYQTLRRVKPVEDRLLRGEVGTFPDHAERFRLRVLAHALEIWDRNTGALGRLDIDPLPHQIRLAHKVLTSGNPNWLIADDVGLGKTIEVGLILHGLARRNRARRVLIVCPAPLVRQWQDEMRLKFGQHYEIYGRDFQVPEPSYWRLHDKVIVSLDLAKRDKVRGDLCAAGGWDVVIFDEAHRLGRDDNGECTQRHRLAQELRRQTPAMLLLTATPHQGKTPRFAALLKLVRPELRRAFSTLEANPEIVAEVVLRNRKTRVTDAAGKPLFHGHETHRIAVEPGPASLAFMDELTRYLRHGYAVGERAGDRGRAIGFMMTTYRKLASSSIAAITTALLGRWQRLQAAQRANAAPDLETLIEASEATPDGLADQPDLFAGAAFFEGEAAQILRLLRLAEPIWPHDEKLRVFIDQIAAPVFRSGRKLLVFTEYRATQTYLREALLRALPEAGEAVLINGTMSLDEKLASIERFTADAAFLISTEAGGEGLNLQERCHVMANYDLPWNPSRLVQRIGRLYRYGQKHRVIVFNLHTQDSFDAKALGLMLDRVQVMARDLAAVGAEFREAMEAEILGELLESIEIEPILERAMRTRPELGAAEIDRALEEARQARSLQDELLSFATGFDGSSSSATFGIDRRHVAAFLGAMLPRIGARNVEPVHQGRALSFELPDELVGVFPELGRRRSVTIALDRDLARHHREMLPVDLDGSLFRHLLDTAKARAFDGLYAAARAGRIPAWVAVHHLRWQNERGELLEDELVASCCEAGGESGRPLSPEELGSLLLMPLESATPTASAPRMEVDTALRQAFETTVARVTTWHRQPASAFLLAAAEAGSEGAP